MDRIQPHVDSARKFLLERIPSDRNSQILLAGGALSVAGVVLYPVVLHYALGRQLTVTRPNASARAASVDCKEVDSFPSDLIEHPKDYRIIHEKVVKYLPKIIVTLSNKNEGNFSKVLRHQMITFSNTLTGLLLWYSVKYPHLRQTFKKEYIESLDFKEGDVVCGVYEVSKRTPLRVEFRLNPARSIGPVDGLLIVSVRPRNEGGVLTNETVQWVKKSTGMVLPLERFVFWFWHSLVTRYVTITAAKFLEDISA